MNVLLTCAGRRPYLIEFFRSALAGRGRVLACDCSGAAPALLSADQQFLVPPSDHPEYIDSLLVICREQRVRMLVSVSDLELDALSRSAERFRAVGTLPVISPPPTIATCQDKWATFQFLQSNDIPTPATFLSPRDAGDAITRGAIRFPLLIKPRWGVSSIGMETVENEQQLALAASWIRIQLSRTILAKSAVEHPEECLIFQEKLAGEEYGLDVVNDLEGQHVATLARRKLVMRYGNTDRAITVSNRKLERLGQMIGRRLQHIGSLDCDVLETERGLSVLDLNPRFGGGYPFSHLAGANVPAALIAWANGEQADVEWLRSRPGVLGSKFDGVVMIPELNNEETKNHACKNLV